MAQARSPPSGLPSALACHAGRSASHADARLGLLRLLQVQQCLLLACTDYVVKRELRHPEGNRHVAHRLHSGLRLSLVVLRQDARIHDGARLRVALDLHLAPWCLRYCHGSPRPQDVEAIRPLTLADNLLSKAEVLGDERPAELLEFVGLQVAEERHGLQELHELLRQWLVPALDNGVLKGHPFHHPEARRTGRRDRGGPCLAVEQGELAEAVPRPQLAHLDAGRWQPLSRHEDLERALLDDVEHGPYGALRDHRLAGLHVLWAHGPHCLKHILLRHQPEQPR
mmetsp:Transcript_61993/g.171835  ORF Transcript_61993/g.171835 Transcript_61993/m.171835 type:complete len:283 (+) Transcript_61993:108-956(+)